MTEVEIVQVKRLRTVAELRDRLAVLGIADQLGVDDAVDPRGPLCTPFSFVDGSTGAHTVGNRFAVLPMEGWDAESDGRPSELVRRRWRRFGESGAKLVWGGEAVAVRHDGRANPRQLVLDPHDRRRSSRHCVPISSMRTSPLMAATTVCSSGCSSRIRGVGRDRPERRSR